MTITALPTPPSRSDPSNFASRADAFLGALPTFVTETNATASSLSSSETNAATSASNAAISASSADASKIAAEAASTIAVAAYDSFDDRYLGSKSSDPVLDNDGNALLTGALYWNSSLSTMKVYSGSAWSVVAPVATSVTSTQISDSTIVGRSLIVATNATDARTAIGAGTGDVLLATAQTITAPKRGTLTTDNDLSFDLNVTNNFSCTTAGSGTLTFTNIASSSGQSGFILLVNASNHTISAAATTKVSSTLLARISTSGTYLVSYLSNGTNVYLVVSEAFT